MCKNRSAVTVDLFWLCWKTLQAQVPADQKAAIETLSPVTYAKLLFSSIVTAEINPMLAHLFISHCF